jgi:hypothetical protein
MKCLGPSGYCQRTAPCEHACAMRVEPVAITPAATAWDRLEQENAELRRALEPFARLGRDDLSSATVTYRVARDPERQTFQTPSMHRAFNRAAALLATTRGVAPSTAFQPVAFHDKDQPNAIAWCPGFPEGLKDMTPLFASGVTGTSTNQPEQPR